MAKERDWLGLAGRVCVVTGAASGIGAAVLMDLVPRPGFEAPSPSHR